MQVKALQQGLKVVEIPVSYRPRLGRSKVSGTLSGTVKAGFKILWTIARLSLRHPLPETKEKDKRKRVIHEGPRRTTKGH